MKDYCIQYYQKISALLSEVCRTQHDSILSAARLVSDSIKNGGILHFFGCSHASIPAQEAFYRAGGLIPVNPIFDKRLSVDFRPIMQTSDTERVQGLAGEILREHRLDKADTAIIHSNSGKNAVSVEMCEQFRSRGIPTIAITAVEFSKKSASNARSGKRLFEAADIVIDNCGVYGDAVLAHEGFGERFAPTSSVTGCAIVNMITAQVIQNLIEQGITPPVFRSANIEGGQEYNRALIERYKDRIGAYRDA